MYRLFDVIPGFVWAILLVLMTALSGFNYIRLKHEQTEHAHTKQIVAEATRKAEQEARAKEQFLRQQIEQVAQNAEAKNRQLARRASTALASLGGLRDTIYSLNSRAAPANSEAAALSHEARTARELLGACAKEYRALAESADGLRDQVNGLQEYAGSVAAP